MFKELKVILSASIQKLKQGMKNAIGVVSGGERKIKQSSNKINQSLNNAFGGDTRTKIDDLNDKINTTKKELIKAEAEVRRYKKDLEGLKEGDKNFEKLNNSLTNNQNKVKVATAALKSYNTELRQNKTNLANSRLAAEDNQSALESMSRTLTAVSSAVLLMDDSSESLRNTMKTLNFAFAAANAVVSINNLKLRENQLFLKASAKASNVLSKATRTAAGSFSVLKTSLSALGVGLVVGLLSSLAYKLYEVISASNKAAKSQREFNESFSDIAGEEISNMESLVSVINDTSLSLGTRKQSLQELQSLFPNYFKDLKDEDILNGNAKIAVDNLTKAILANAKARVYQQRIAENTKELVKSEEELEQANVGLDGVNKRLNDGNKKTSATYALLSNQFKESEKDITKLKNRITELNKENDKYAQIIDKIRRSTDPFTGGGSGSGGDGKAKAAKKSFEQITNLQTKALISEERLRAEQEKKFLKTEEEKVRATIASEERILAIKRSAILQAATAQNLSASQVTELLRNLALQEIKLQSEKSARLQVARNKDTDNAIASEELKAKQVEESLKGSLVKADEITNQSLANLANAYRRGEIDLATYEYNKTLLTIEGLEARKRILESFGEDVSKIEQKIGDLQAKYQKKSSDKTKENAKKTGQAVGRIVAQTARQLASSLTNLLSESFDRAFAGTSKLAELDLEILKKQQEELEYTMQKAGTTEVQRLQQQRQYLENEQKLMEASQSNMQKLQQGILASIADFLDALGRGLVAAALASKAFQESLLANPLLALGAGVAAIAAASLVRSKLQKGPAFADGGIVSGPTLGLVGEYPGASTNPEVIAPLDKLKNMIGGGMSEGGYIAETRVSGRDLALVLSRYEKDRTRG